MAGYSPWDCKESDMTEHACTHTARARGMETDTSPNSEAQMLCSRTETRQLQHSSSGDTAGLGSSELAEPELSTSPQSRVLLPQRGMSPDPCVELLEDEYFSASH